MERSNLNEKLENSCLKDRSFEITGNSDLFKDLYEVEFPRIRNYVLVNRGTEDDAEDVFQDVMELIVCKLRNNLLNNQTLSSYVFRIGKNVWKRKIREKMHSIQYPYIESSIFAACEQDRYYNDNQLDNDISFNNEVQLSREADLKESSESIKNLTIKHFKTIKKSSRELLMLYLNNYDIDEIAEITGLYGENSVRKKLCKCRKSLLEQIKKDPKYVELATERAKI